MQMVNSIASEYLRAALVYTLQYRPSLWYSIGYWLWSATRSGAPECRAS